VRLADGRQITRHVGIVILATDVDHVIAVAGETDPLFYVEENHQALCHECHSFKTALENGAFGNAKVFAR
jgi:5-methylcytosine-specific restriction endonuclease McrA